MTDQERDTYVRATLALHGYPADEAFVAPILVQFAAISRIAATFVDADLPLETELAPVFRP